VCERERARVRVCARVSSFDVCVDAQGELMCVCERERMLMRAWARRCNKFAF